MGQTIMNAVHCDALIQLIDIQAFLIVWPHLSINVERLDVSRKRFVSTDVGYYADSVLPEGKPVEKTASNRLQTRRKSLHLFCPTSLLISSIISGEREWEEAKDTAVVGTKAIFLFNGNQVV